MLGIMNVHWVWPKPDPNIFSNDYGNDTGLACLWIDDKSKDYLVVWSTEQFLVLTKKGYHMWRPVSSTHFSYCLGKAEDQMLYHHNTQKLYLHRKACAFKIWCFSSDAPQQVFEFYAPIEFNYRDFLPDRSKDEGLYLKEERLYVKEYVDSRLNMAISAVSGQVLKVAYAVQKSKRCFFRVYKMHPIKLCWEMMDTLGEEALILDMGITVVAKDIAGIKRNSIYFSGIDYGRKNPDHIFVFDLNTQKTEPLPQCVLSSIHFSDARWFFPGP